MDDLAGAAGVSRRTLFNHFPGKLDAVLGPTAAFPDECIATFRSGGPHGDLVLDLRDLADRILDAEQIGRAELALVRRLLRGNPKLLAAVHERFLLLSEQLVEQIQLREGPQFGQRRARVAVGVLAALLDAALASFLDCGEPGARPGSERALAAHFDESLGYARELLAPPSREGAI